MKSVTLNAHDWTRLVTRGSKRFFLFGVLASLAWAPYHYIACLYVSLCALMLRIEVCDSVKKAFRCGWWWGWGFYLSTLFWAGNSLWVDGARFGWLWPFSVLGLPGFFAFYPACTVSFVLFCKKRFSLNSLGYGLCFVLSWSLYEYLQGCLFTGFPWNLTAYIWAPYLPVAQWAAIVGSYGLGLLTLFFFSWAGILLLRHWSWRSLTLGILISGIGIGSLAWVGYTRLQRTPSLFHEHIWLRLVQPNFDQREKIDPRYGPEHFQKLISLSTRPSYKQPTHVIWAEGSFPWSLSPDTLSLFPPICDPDSPFVLLWGCSYQENKEKVFNSLMTLDSTHEVRPIYAKTHLLPFGEYVPCRSFLSWFIPCRWLKKITPGEKDFVPGPRTYITQCEGLPPFRCLICYEAIFPGQVRAPQKETSSDKPQWILNITNDGWFGHSPGPHQHFVSAQFRAIEQGLPLVRAGNTGVSAIIDPLGRILYFLPLNTEGIVEGKLPKALDSTYYSEYGNTLWAIGLLVLAMGILASRKRNHRHEQ